MSVLILGREDDIHVTLVRHRCPDCFVIDLGNARALSTGWIMDSDLAPEPLADDIWPDPESICSVYWRSVTFPSSLLHKSDSRNAFGILSFLLDCYGESTWFNDIASFCSHVSKPVQLRLVKRAGIAIPATLVTASEENARWFMSHYGAIAVKPVSGGDYTRRIDTSNANEVLPVVFSSGVPMIVQKFISGPSIRTFVIEERAYSARIESSLPDYRIDSSVVVSRISTPEAISGQAIAIMNCLGLRWTAIDWIQGHDGVYYFLEANFSPMFSAFSEMTGYPVADYLSRALLRSR